MWVSGVLGGLLFADTVRAQSPYAVQPSPSKWSPTTPVVPKLPTPVQMKKVSEPVRHKVAYQQPMNPAAPTTDDSDQGYRIDLEPPGPERLFVLESEGELFERLRQEALDRSPQERIEFPEEPELTKEPYYGRDWPMQKRCVEPIYVCHKRLYFEEVNAERHAWELAGVFQPVLSAAIFFKDVALLPFHLGTDPCRCYDCSAGKCLPGDPVPYLWYPPELSASGTLVQVGTMAALFAIFP